MSLRRAAGLETWQDWLEFAGTIAALLAVLAGVGFGVLLVATVAGAL